MSPLKTLNIAWWTLLELTLLLFLASGLQAQDIYYVRAGATGVNNGSDWNNAYTALPATLVRGAVYYVASGNYVGYSCNTPDSASNTITIKKATGTDHGTDMGWQSVYGSSVALFDRGIDFSSDYWIIDGQTGSDATGYGIEICGFPSQGVVNMATGVKHISVSHCDVHVYSSGTAYANMTYFGHLFYVLSGSYISVSRCYLHDVFGAHFLWRSVDHMTVEYNYVARNKSTAAQHSEGISFGITSNIIIRYNKWSDLDGTSWLTGLQGADGSYEDAWDVYGNVLWDSGKWPCSISDVIEIEWGYNTARNWHVYNNTFAKIQGNPELVFQSPYGSGIVIENNLWWQGQPQSDTAVHDYVVFAISGGGNSEDYNYLAACSVVYYSPGAHDTPISFDENHVAIYTDPFVNSATGDFRLNAPLDGYPGLALSAPYDRDMNGNTRGADGTWDRGAYEYDARGRGMPVLSASPRGLDFGRIANNASVCGSFMIENKGAGTLAGTANVAAPFFVVQGDAYSLGPGQRQQVIVRFSPVAVGTNTETIWFTGGGGASGIVTGVATSGN